jgi:hypothetical protein
LIWWEIFQSSLFLFLWLTKRKQLILVPFA